MIVFRALPYLLFIFLIVAMLLACDILPPLSLRCYEVTFVKSECCTQQTFS